MSDNLYIANLNAIGDATRLTEAMLQGGGLSSRRPSHAGVMARSAKNLLAQDVFHDAFDSYAHALDVKPDMHQARHNGGRRATLADNNQRRRQGRALACDRRGET